VEKKSIFKKSNRAFKNSKMKKIFLSILLTLGFLSISNGQDISFEIGAGWVSPNTRKPMGIRSFVLKGYYYVPVTKTGDLIIGPGFLFYKIYNPSINSRINLNDVLSAYYSYNFIDNSKYEGRLFAGYQGSGFLIKDSYIQKNIAHWITMGGEVGPWLMKIRLSFSKMINPLQISTGEETFKIYPTMITFSLVFF